MIFDVLPPDVVEHIFVCLSHSTPDEIRYQFHLSNIGRAIPMRVRRRLKINIGVKWYNPKLGRTFPASTFVVMGTQKEIVGPTLIGDRDEYFSFAQCVEERVVADTMSEDDAILAVNADNLRKFAAQARTDAVHYQQFGPTTCLTLDEARNVANPIIDAWQQRPLEDRAFRCLTLHEQTKRGFRKRLIAAQDEAVQAVICNRALEGWATRQKNRVIALVGERNTTIAQRDAVIAQRDAVIAQHEMSIAQRDAVIAQHAVTIAQLRDAVNASRDEILRTEEEPAAEERASKKPRTGDAQ